MPINHKQLLEKLYDYIVNDVGVLSVSRRASGMVRRFTTEEQEHFRLIERNLAHEATRKGNEAEALRKVEKWQAQEHQEDAFKLATELPRVGIDMEGVSKTLVQHDRTLADLARGAIEDREAMEKLQAHYRQIHSLVVDLANDILSRPLYPDPHHRLEKLEGAGGTLAHGLSDLEDVVEELELRVGNMEPAAMPGCPAHSSTPLREK